MKLIIDIVEETYNDIQSRDWKNGVFSEEWKAIHNGILLDTIRAKIESQMSSNGFFNDGIERALLIIDKYREGEEE